MTYYRKQQYQQDRARAKVRVKAVEYPRLGDLWGYVVLIVMSVIMMVSMGCNKLVKIQEEKVVDSAVVKQELKTYSQMEDIIVPKTFTWNTSQRISVGISVLGRDGLVSSGALVTVLYKDNTYGDEHILFNGLSDSEGLVDSVFNVPTYVRSVILKSGGTSVEVPINSYSFDYTLRL